ncbi:MAG: M24 family metallopeptidase, partial [Chloroflexota bacterium]|nr:M24 family metallopeptidase [Chloroflexota bacterium]
MSAGTSMVTIKRREEIERMRHAGSILVDVLEALREELRAGVSTADLDVLAERIIRDAGAVPSFLGYRGFPRSICVSINDEVVHG